MGEVALYGPLHVWTQILEGLECLDTGPAEVPRETPTPPGSPQVPRHRATVGSYGGGVSYERGTPVEGPPMPREIAALDVARTPFTGVPCS